MPAARTTVRMTDEMADSVALVCQIDGITITELINRAIDAHLHERITDPEFRKKAQDHLQHDRNVLNKLTKGAQE